MKEPVAASERRTTPSRKAFHSVTRMWCGASTGGNKPANLKSLWNGTNALSHTHITETEIADL